MAVAYTSDTDKTPATGSSFSYTSFTVSGSNPVIIVLIGLDSTTATISSVAVSAGLTAGTPVEVITQRVGRAYTSLWAIPAPSGTGTITVTLSASVPWQSNAILFSGADQTTPCPTGSGNAEVGGTIDGDTLGVTLANLTANDAAVGIGANAGFGDNPLHDQTRTFAGNTTNVNASTGYHLATGVISCSWGAFPVGNAAYVGARIVAAAAAPSTPGVGYMLNYHR